MLQLLVEKPTQMLGMLSDICISICYMHGAVHKPVHLKTPFTNDMDTKFRCISLLV
jgi:hypothetical protein